jgi:arabinogalactan oligomer/maltooligosaccharide transport system substrate-binding protein
MCSFTGYKLVGVNAYTQNADWAMRLARRMTDEKNQLKRFEDTGECPSNVNAESSDEVQAAPAVAALAEQSRYGYIQSVAEPFWNASSLFGITIAGGNADNNDLQALLDTMVDGITAKEAS